jgi:hypothetical protein
MSQWERTQNGEQKVGFQSGRIRKTGAKYWVVKRRLLRIDCYGTWIGKVKGFSLSQSSKSLCSSRHISSFLYILMMIDWGYDKVPFSTERRRNSRAASVMWCRERYHREETDPSTFSACRLLSESEKRDFFLEVSYWWVEHSLPYYRCPHCWIWTRLRTVMPKYGQNTYSFWTAITVQRHGNGEDGLDRLCRRLIFFFLPVLFFSTDADQCRIQMASGHIVVWCDKLLQFLFATGHRSRTKPHPWPRLLDCLECLEFGENTKSVTLCGYQQLGLNGTAGAKQTNIRNQMVKSASPKPWLDAFNWGSVEIIMPQTDWQELGLDWIEWPRLINWYNKGPGDGQVWPNCLGSKWRVFFLFLSQQST